MGSSPRPAFCSHHPQGEGGKGGERGLINQLCGGCGSAASGSAASGMVSVRQTRFRHDACVPRVCENRGRRTAKCVPPSPLGPDRISTHTERCAFTFRFGVPATPSVRAGGQQYPLRRARPPQGWAPSRVPRGEDIGQLIQGTQRTRFEDCERGIPANANAAACYARADRPTAYHCRSPLRIRCARRSRARSPRSLGAAT